MSTRRISPVAAGTAALYLSLILTPSLQAGARRRAAAGPPPSLSLTFVASGAAGTGVVDAGTMSWRGGRERFTVTTRTVTVRIGPASPEARGRATLRAFLETPDPHATIRIDGIVLGTAPRVIRRGAPIGIPFTHRLEIEVPVSAPEGPLAATIGWEVTTE